MLPSTPFLLRGPIRAGAAAVTGAFDPAQITSHVTLSGNNNTATAGASVASGDGARAVRNNAAGKYYCEFTLTAYVGGASQVGCGIVRSTFTMGANFVGGTTDSYAFFAGDGNFYTNGVTDSGIATYTTNDVICMAVDLDNTRIWFRINGGNWNNSATADPATNTEGRAILAAGGNPYYPAVDFESSTATSAWTLNVGGSAYARTPPSGFVNW